MRFNILGAMFALLAFPAIADDKACSCIEFPFKPEPPCNSFCLKKLTSTPNPDLSGIKSLDPGVALSIRVISQSPDAKGIDFSRVRTKKDLETLALFKVEQNYVRVVPNR